MIQRQLPAGMLVLCVLAVTGCQDRAGPTVRAVAVTAKGTERLGGIAGVEYVSGVVTLHERDAITVHVLNYSAREHYVPSGQRQNTWHPIVHEEMEKKDFEATKAEPAPTRA